jgi:hypothetical protein
VGAHRLVPVAGDPVDAAGVVRAAGHRIGGVGVDRLEPGEHDRVVVVEELAREEERPGEAVVLRSVMAVVLVGRGRVDPEAPVVGLVERQAVAVPEQDVLLVPPHQQLGRERAVERPGLQRVLDRQPGVEAGGEVAGRDAGVVVRRHARVVAGVGARPLRHDRHADLRSEQAEVLVGPERTGRSAFDRPRVSGDHAGQGGVEHLLRLVGFRRRLRIEIGRLRRARRAARGIGCVNGCTLPSERLEVVKALSHGRISRRELFRMGVFTAAGALVLKNGLSPFARSAYADGIRALTDRRVNATPGGFS